MFYIKIHCLTIQLLCTMQSKYVVELTLATNLVPATSRIKLRHQSKVSTPNHTVMPALFSSYLMDLNPSSTPGTRYLTDLNPSSTPGTSQGSKSVTKTHGSATVSRVDPVPFSNKLCIMTPSLLPLQISRPHQASPIQFCQDQQKKNASQGPSTSR